MSDQALPIGEIFDKARVSRVSELVLMENEETGELYAGSDHLEQRGETLAIDAASNQVRVIPADEVSDLQARHLPDLADETIHHD